MIGRTVAHYQVLERLGAGGMGEIYLAEDAALGRKIVLKFIHPSIADNPEQKLRFQREARAAAALNHPNIVTIYEVGEFEDRPFMAMEHVEGIGLDDYGQEQQLSWEVLVRIALQIAAGLAAAHKAGIVHRDLKPSNVLVTSERIVKIIDFGIAKVLGASQLTRTEASLGTAAYMSPEQISGSEVDARSDLFAFGTLMYQLVAGQLPFHGDHDAALAYAIVHESPPPLKEKREDIPDVLDKIISRCLSKEAEQRYPATDELIEDLEAAARVISPAAGKAQDRKSFVQKMLLPVLVSAVLLIALALVFRFFFGGRESQVRKMLAVLPFQNMGEADREYFADGLTEEVTSRLGAIHNLGVISRTSAMAYKNYSGKVQEIAKELGVQYLVEGSVRWYTAPNGKDLLKVSATLVNGSDGAQMLTLNFEEELANVFAIQSDIGEAVAHALDITLFKSEREAISEKSTGNLDAYDSYLRGNSYLNRGVQPDDLNSAIRLYEIALEKDPEFVAALARLSQAHAIMYWWGYEPATDHLGRAKLLVEKALMLNPALPEAHLAKGYYYYYGFLNYSSALDEFHVALKDQRSNSDLLAAIGYVRRRQGQFDSSLVYLEQSFALDPRSAPKAFEIGNTNYRLRRWDEAEENIDNAIVLAPDSPRAHALKIRAYVYENGDIVRANNALMDAQATVPPSSLNEEEVWLEGLQGNFEKALRSLKVVNDDSATFYYSKFRLYSFDHQSEAAANAGENAKRILESYLVDEPDEPSLLRHLAVLYAGLGQPELAMSTANRALELMPIEKDAFYGGPEALFLRSQAAILAGDDTQALDDISQLFELPAGLISPAYLRIAPEYEGLRDSVRFREMVEVDSAEVGM